MARQSQLPSSAEELDSLIAYLVHEMGEMNVQFIENIQQAEDTISAFYTRANIKRHQDVRAEWLSTLADVSSWSESDLELAFEQAGFPFDMAFLGYKGFIGAMRQVLLRFAD